MKHEIILESVDEILDSNRLVSEYIKNDHNFSLNLSINMNTGEFGVDKDAKVYFSTFSSIDIDQSISLQDLISGALKRCGISSSFISTKTAKELDSLNKTYE